MEGAWSDVDAPVPGKLPDLVREAREAGGEAEEAGGSSWVLGGVGGVEEGEFWEPFDMRTIWPFSLSLYSNEMLRDTSESPKLGDERGEREVEGVGESRVVEDMRYWD
jgi:hypothetical protein